MSTAPTPVVDDEATRPHARHFALAILALSLGGFTIGTTEFVTMGLLPEMAAGVGVSIPEAGHVISTYALGVVVGAPLIAVLGARLPRKGLLLALMVAYGVANSATAVAPSFVSLAAARFVWPRLPHGAYFGVASLVAAGLAGTGAPQGPCRSPGYARAGRREPGGRPRRGVAGTAPGMARGLRRRDRLGLVTCADGRRVRPGRLRADREATGSRELRAFSRVQVWLTLLVGAVGFGGMFALYSYIAPTVTDVTGLSSSAVPLYLLAFGIGGILGTTLGGVLADWSVLRSMVIGNIAMGFFLVLFSFTLTASSAGGRLCSPC